MTCNVGNPDRLVRLDIGTRLFLLPIASDHKAWTNDVAKYAATAIGAVLALTSTLHTRPLHRIPKLNICRM